MEALRRERWSLVEFGLGGVWLGWSWGRGWFTQGHGKREAIPESGNNLSQGPRASKRVVHFLLFFFFFFARATRLMGSISWLCLFLAALGVFPSGIIPLPQCKDQVEERASAFYACDPPNHGFTRGSQHSALSLTKFLLARNSRLVTTADL